MGHGLSHPCSHVIGTQRTGIPGSGQPGGHTSLPPQHSSSSGFGCLDHLHFLLEPEVRRGGEHLTISRRIQRRDGCSIVRRRKTKIKVSSLQFPGTPVQIQLPPETGPQTLHLACTPCLRWLFLFLTQSLGLQEGILDSFYPSAQHILWGQVGCRTDDEGNLVYAFVIAEHEILSLTTVRSQESGGLGMVLLVHLFKSPGIDLLDERRRGSLWFRW